MASFVKGMITGSTSSVDSGEKDKYLLAVSAATSYDDTASRQVVINGPPCEVNSRVKVAVRIKEYQGLPLGSPPTSSYFEDPAHSKDTYSIAVSWIPDEDVDAEDLVWGMELINPIGDRIPKRFITTAFDIVKGFVDPSLKCDPYADRPWLNGPILCSSAITWSIGENDRCEVPDVLSEGASGNGASVREQHNIPSDEEKRRKHFSDAGHRKGFKFEKGRCYSFDFHNGYIDWKNYALKLPGFSFGVLKYINERSHTLRFVMKNRNKGELCVATTFRLLFGQDLEQAIQADKHEGKTSETATGGGSAPSHSTPKGSKQEDPKSKSKDVHRTETDQSEHKEKHESKKHMDNDGGDPHEREKHEDTAQKSGLTENRMNDRDNDEDHDANNNDQNNRVYNGENQEKDTAEIAKDTTERPPEVIHDDHQDKEKNHINLAFDQSVKIDDAPSRQGDNGHIEPNHTSARPTSSIEDSLVATATEDNRPQ